MFKKLFNRLAGNSEAEVEVEKVEARESEAPEPEAQPETPAPQSALQEETKTEEVRAEELPETSAPAMTSDPLGPEEKEDIKNRVIDMMKTIFDPEIPVNVYDIGLIYKVEPQDDGILQLTMTLTTPNCPAAGILPGEIESKARSVDGVHDVDFELTFDPPWNPEMMSEGARLELGMM
jgi:FeS assembly SUF system protein